MAIGFPKGPGKRSKEWSQGRKHEAAEFSEQGNNGGQSTARHLGMTASVTARWP